MPSWQVVCDDYENNPQHWGFCKHCGFVEYMHQEVPGVKLAGVYYGDD